MELEQRFSIPVGLDEAWDLLLDVARVAPCFPGVEVGDVTEDVVTGSVRVKLGPVLLNYKGQATFVQRDEHAHRVMIEAKGSDSKGGGGASAKVVAALKSLDASATECTISTDLDITGRPAQFGRGFMSDVAEKMTSQFVSNLAVMLAQSDTAQGDPIPAGSVNPRNGVGPQQPLDLLEVSGIYSVRRLLPLIVAIAVPLMIRYARKAAASRQLVSDP